MNLQMSFEQHSESGDTFIERTFLSDRWRVYVKSHYVDTFRTREEARSCVRNLKKLPIEELDAILELTR